MDCHVHPTVKKARMQDLLSLGQAKLQCFMEDQLGTFNEVLFEKKNKAGLWEGYTSNFLKVQLQSDDDLKNKIKEVKLISLQEAALQAELI